MLQLLTYSYHRALEVTMPWWVFAANASEHKPDLILMDIPDAGDGRATRRPRPIKADPALRASSSDCGDFLRAFRRRGKGAYGRLRRLCREAF